jgi:hypothetical protein
MKMKKSTFTSAVILFCTLLCSTLYAQEKQTKLQDSTLKDSIYNANKKKVYNFSLKEFDQLFFEFSDKKANPDHILTKMEFYTYTIKIAAFSDRLAILYPDQKEVANANKIKWFAENYEDYLLSKASHK